MHNIHRFQFIGHASNGNNYPQPKMKQSNNFEPYSPRNIIMCVWIKQDSQQLAGVTSSVQTQVNQVTSEALINIQCKDEIHEIG